MLYTVAYTPNQLDVYPMSIHRIISSNPKHTRKKLSTSTADGHSTPLLYGIDQVRAIEEQALAEVSSTEPSLMQRAGLGLYKFICARYPHARNIWVVAGKGNNGGDAIEAAAQLKQNGRRVYITWLGDEQHLNADCKKAVQAARAQGLSMYPYSGDELKVFTDKVHTVDLIIDGLLGIGFNADKPLERDISTLMMAMNHTPAPVLAVDIPSGLLADTGNAIAQTVKAESTLTFLCNKVGLFTAQGREYAGEVWLDTLGSHVSFPPPSALLYHPLQHEENPHQSRAHNTHKGSFGDVAIVGGAQGMAGAALLAARAAVKAGAGRVFNAMLTSSEQNTPLDIDVNAPEIMFKPWSKLELETTTVACGCGGGTAVANTLARLFKLCPRLVLDADALNAISASTQLQNLFTERAHSGYSTIITPHPLEAARLLRTDTQTVQNNRLLAAQKLADLYSCTCILKGSGTVIATPDQTPYVNSSGNAALATAGTGDVLAGWLAGSWAGITTPLDDTKRHQLAAQCVWTHGQAADAWLQAGNVGTLPASTLIEWLGNGY